MERRRGEKGRRAGVEAGPAEVTAKHVIRGSRGGPERLWLALPD